MQAGGHSQGRAMTQGSHFRRFLIQSSIHPSIHPLILCIVERKAAYSKRSGKEEEQAAMAEGEVGRRQETGERAEIAEK